MPTIETTTDLDLELAQKVKKLLDMFRPIFQSEGGDAQLLSLKDGVATISMGGGCDGCGGSLSAMEGGVIRTLMEKVDGLKDVVIAS
ncbi:MAG: NifU family protein [Calditrichaeota bacterium]|nr:NifU family protein [Calditrichota bacterium]MCB9391397.1 NifU family protein [Calditrichota bacterium]